MPRLIESSLAAALLAALTLAACGSSPKKAPTTASTQSGTTSPQTPAIGFEGVPLEQGPALAPASTTTPGSTVDEIQCGATEQLVYHIHAHLAVYDHGALRSLPAGVGIPGSQAEQTQYGPIAAGGNCIYWLHTHTTDGVIHVESPIQRIYTLGNFFDEWRQPLSSTQVAGVSGKVLAYVNGKVWTKSLKSIPLDPHSVIQLDVGTPAPPFMSMSWTGTQL
jgi:hypothetical protein